MSTNKLKLNNKQLSRAGIAKHYAKIVMVLSHFFKSNDTFSHQLISLLPFDLKPEAWSSL